MKNFNQISIPKSKPREEEICQSNVLNLEVFRVCHTMSCEMAGNEFGVSEVYNWLSSISHGLNLERLAPEFERRGFLSKHSLKYMAQNDLEIIINSPDKLLLAEKRILEKELEELKKPPLQPKELFPVPYTGSLQVVNNHINSAVVGSSSNVSVEGAGASLEKQSAANESTQQSTSYLEKKGGELTENLSIIQTQIRSATDQLETVRNQYEQASSKANGRRGKLCTRCHRPGHYKGRCTNPPCTDMNSCGASEKHPESRSEITELQKLIKELQKKEAKASEELQAFKLAKERSVNGFFAVMRPRLRRQNEGRYVDRFALDKDLILLKNIFNNKIPVDTSGDWEMPFQIERFRRGLPSLNIV